MDLKEVDVVCTKPGQGSVNLIEYGGTREAGLVSIVPGVGHLRLCDGPNVVCDEEVAFGEEDETFAGNGKLNKKGARLVDINNNKSYI